MGFNLAFKGLRGRFREDGIHGIVIYNRPESVEIG
jgi:hypothetical protein